MVRKDEAEGRALGAVEIAFEPARLLLPESVPSSLRGCGIFQVAINHGEVSVAPIEGVIRTGLHVAVIVSRIAFVVTESREEGGFPQQRAFDGEEDGPERGVVAIRNQVAGMHDEIRLGVFENSLDHGAVHVVPGARIAIHHELELRVAGGRGLERPPAGLPGERLVGVGVAGAKPGQRDFFRTQ
jgi:hypothetical protein